MKVHSFERVKVDSELNRSALLMKVQEINYWVSFAETWTTFEPVSETIVGEVGGLKERNAQHVPAWSLCQVV